MSEHVRVREAPDLLTTALALTALRRIANAWGLEPFEAVALVTAASDDLTSVEWSTDRLTRVGYLIELEKALQELSPRVGVARWIRTRNPGPLFSGNSPLQLMTGGTRDLMDLLRQVREWRRH